MARKRQPRPVKRNTTRGSRDFDWLLAPPEPHEVHLHIAVGKEAKLTSAVRKALETLLKALNEEHPVAQARMMAECCKCSLNKCQPVVSTPTCFSYETCRIAG